MTRMLYTREETAEQLSVSVRQIDRLASNGTLPKLYIGGCPRFASEDIQRVIRTARRKAMRHSPARADDDAKEATEAQGDETREPAGDAPPARRRRAVDRRLPG